MFSFKLGCLNVGCLGSDWNQNYLLDNPRLHCMDLEVAIKIRLRGLQAFSPLLKDYKKFIPPSQPRGGGV